MLKQFSLAVVCVLILNLWLSQPLRADFADKHPLPEKEAVIVVDNTSGNTLYANNQDQALPPASLTKLMTALLVLEKGRLSDIVTVGNEVLGVDGAVVGLSPGDTISVENLLYSLLVHSGNDAANVLAVFTAGSLDKFSAAMNGKAKSLGMVNSNFVNPHGLPAPNHFSTARDISVLARTAIQNPVIQTIVATKQREIVWQQKNGSVKRVQVENTNKLLDVYPGVAGMKTGTTIEAGQCLVTFAKGSGGEVIIVLLNSANRYQGTTYLLDQTYRTLQLNRAGNILVENSWLSF